MSLHSCCYTQWRCVFACPASQGACQERRAEHTGPTTPVPPQGWPWVRWVRQRLRSAELRGALQLLQFGSSVVFVCLYVASTYSAPAPFSLRYNIDILLCLLFAADYVARVVVPPPACRPASHHHHIITCMPSS